MGDTRIPDGGGSPRINESTHIENEDRQPGGTTRDVMEANTPIAAGGGSSTVSTNVGNVLNRGRDAELTGSGDASARETIDTLAALFGTKPSSAISERALAALEALGHVEAVDRPVLVELRAQAKSISDGMAELSKLDASIEAAKETAGSLGARLGSFFGGDKKAEAEKKLVELRKERSVVAKRLGEEPAMKLEKVEGKIAAICETDHGLIQLAPSARPLMDMLELEPQVASIRSFVTRFKKLQAGIDEAADIQKQVFDQIQHCGETASSLYALVSQQTGKGVSDIKALHDWLWTEVDECGARAVAILGATAAMTNETKEDLKADYRFLFDETTSCGDAAAATLVYACALTGAERERAQTLYRDLFDNTDRCSDEAAAILTLAVLRYGVEVEDIRATYRSIYDPTDSAGDVASAVMVLENAAGRASVSELRADFRTIYDDTKNCGDYEAVLLGRAARRTDLSAKLWGRVHMNIYASRPDVDDSAASLLAAGAASKLTSPEDHENLLELGVLAMAGREDEIDDAAARRRSSSRSGSSSSGSSYSSDDGNDFNFGFGQGWGMGYKGYGYYTSGLKIM